MKVQNMKTLEILFKFFSLCLFLFQNFNKIEITYNPI